MKLTMISGNRIFYSIPRILRRLCSNVWQRRSPLISLVAGRSYRNNIGVDCRAYADFKNQQGNCFTGHVECMKNTAPERPSHRNLNSILVTGQNPGLKKADFEVAQK